MRFWNWNWCRILFFFLSLFFFFFRHISHHLVRSRHENQYSLQPSTGFTTRGCFGFNRNSWWKLLVEIMCWTIALAHFKLIQNMNMNFLIHLLVHGSYCYYSNFKCISGKMRWLNEKKRGQKRRIKKSRRVFTKKKTCHFQRSRKKINFVSRKTGVKKHGTVIESQIKWHQ